METLSLALRGGTSTSTLEMERGGRWASVSLGLHATVIAAFILIPLMGDTGAPEALVRAQTPLSKPITVSLPPAPIAPSQRPRGSGPKKIPAAAVTPDLSPPDVSDLLTQSDVADVLSPGTSDGTNNSIGDSRSAGGECPFGSLCGTSPIPSPSPVPNETPRVGGHIKEPRLLESHPPVYPEVARAVGLAGRVLLEAHVGPDGRVRSVRVLRGMPLFDDAAVVSVRTRRYQPLQLNGVPTDFLITITVDFTIRR